MKIRKCNVGFTSVELLFVIFIIILLVIVVLPSTFRAQINSHRTELRTFVAELGKGITMYRRDHDREIYPGQQFGDSRKTIDVTGSEILAEAMWEPNSNNNGRLDRFPPEEIYLGYTPEHILISGSRYYICDPSFKTVSEDPPDLATQRIIAYYPSIPGNTGKKLEDTFYVNQNTTDDPFTPNVNLPESSDSGRFNLRDKGTGKILGYRSYLLIAPGYDHKDEDNRGEYFRVYNIANRLRE